MARGKKKEELTLEEKLERALVPVEEQPYEVPGNWCWVKLNSVTEIYTGNSINEKIKREKYLHQSEGLHFIATKDIGFDHSISYQNGVKINDYDKFKVAPENTSLLCIEGGSAGRKLGYTREKVCFGNKLCAFVSKGCISKYIYYYLQSNAFYAQFVNQRHGLIGGVSVKDLSDFFMPIAAIEEQRRIVKRVDRLFAKLDEVKEKMQETLDGFEERKAAILHRAFSGELTEKWRKENKFFKEWKTSTIKECCKMGSGGTPSRKCSEYYQGSIPWIKTGEINWNEISSSEECISEMGVENSSAKIYEEGAILVAMYGMGATRGRAAILKTKAATNQAVCVLAPCKDVLNYFLFYYFMCHYWDVRKQAVGGNQLNLSAAIIGTFEIEIPSMEEQKEIVRLLDVLLKKEEQSKENVEIVLEHIGMLKKSILAKAFRGELGTNNPAEGSAIKLLKTILAET